MKNWFTIDVGMASVFELTSDYYISTDIVVKANKKVNNVKFHP